MKGYSLRKTGDRMRPNLNLTKLQKQLLVTDNKQLLTHLIIKKKQLNLYGYLYRLTVMKKTKQIFNIRTRIEEDINRMT